MAEKIEAVAVVAFALQIAAAAADARIASFDVDTAAIAAVANLDQTEAVVADAIAETRFHHEVSKKKKTI